MRRTAFQFAEANEGAHLVDVAPHLLGEMVEPPPQRIGLVIDRRRCVAQPHQHRVEQREALGVAVEDHRPGQIEEALRHRERRQLRRRQGIAGAAEQVPPFAVNVPDEGIGSDIGQCRSPRGIAPAFEIVGSGKGYAVRHITVRCFLSALRSPLIARRFGGGTSQPPESPASTGMTLGEGTRGERSFRSTRSAPEQLQLFGDLRLQVDPVDQPGRPPVARYDERAQLEFH